MARSACASRCDDVRVKRVGVMLRGNATTELKQLDGSDLLSARTERFDEVRTILAPNAQFCGALGAAIHGINEENDDGLPNHQ